MILGIDEVGRGAWAGPLVVGSVVLAGEAINGLTDSKLLSQRRRAGLNEEIQEKAAGIGLGWVWPDEIDDIGLGPALSLATRRSIKNVGCAFHEIVIDGTVNFLVGTPLESYVSTIKKADLLIPCVSAASIVAKVARDNYMAEQDNVYPGYDFGAHVGYGTPAHRKIIDRQGISPIHRLSIKPLQMYSPSSLSDKSAKDVYKQASLSTRQTGDVSEAAAARALMECGHEIIERNWKTRWCEIDVVSKKGESIYFTEVKHRANEYAGDGLAAITPKKLRQMKYAAELYISKHRLYDNSCQLMAISTSGYPPEVTDMLEIL